MAVAAPPPVTVPKRALPPGTPLTSHWIAAPGATQMVAESNWVCRKPTLEDAGEIDSPWLQTTSTLAVAARDGSATLVAVMLTAAGFGGGLGARYIAESAPEPVMVPACEFPPGTPFTLHTTFVFEWPWLATVAVKSSDPPGVTVADAGAIVTTKSLAIVTAAVALAAGSPRLIAVTCICAGEGNIAGAVYRPAAVIVPAAAVPPLAPLTLQLTAGLELPITVAENCWVAPRITLALLGVTFTETADEEPMCEPPPPVPVPPTILEQPEKSIPASRTARKIPPNRRPVIRRAGLEREIAARTRISARRIFRR